MTGDSGGASEQARGGALPADTTAEQLAELAAARPDLWDGIWNHPNCYEGLRQWMAERYEEQQAAAPPDVAVAPLRHTEADSAKKRNPATAIVASIAAAALVLAGGGTALALTGTWPFASGQATGTAAPDSVDAGSAFASGLERMWAVDSNQLVTPTVGELGQDFSFLRAAFSRGSIALFEADYPVATSSAVMVNARGEESKLVMLDARNGEERFERILDNRDANCVADEGDGREAFVCVATAAADTASATLLRVDVSGEVTEQILDLAVNRVTVDADHVLLTGAQGQALMLNRAGEEQWRRDDLSHGSFAGVDLGSERALIRGYDGWTLLDESGSTLAEAEVMGPYDGGNGACDARLTPSGRLFVATDDPACVQNHAAIEWFGSGENLLGKYFFSTAEGEYVFSQGESTAALLRFPKQKSANGALETVLEIDGAAQYLGVTGGASPVLVLQRNGSVASYAVEDGTQITEWPVAVDQRQYPDQAQRPRASLLLGDTLLLGGAAYDPLTGEALWALDSADAVEAGWMTSAGLLTLGGGCPECSAAGGAYTASTLTLYAPAGTGGTAVSGSLASESGVAAEVPDFVPECPGKTILLAWMELEDGWIVVCGVDVDTPSHVAYKSSKNSREVVSLGSADPSSSLATSSVLWDAAQRRYVAVMANGSKLTLDYTIGTATLRDGESNSNVKEQQRFVRYVFVPLGGQVRGSEDVSAETGAFDVKAPKATSEDQIRYMIEVLEKAYAGRAILKDALPKLAGCAAGPGGYADTVAAMQAVRDNRAELLAALDAMPVDKIPEGKQLLADLTEAIELSHQANVEYVAWAEAANASGCATLSAAGKTAADASDAPKERFASRWNSVIAPKYGVRSFDGWFI